MRIVIATTQVPFIYGGAEALAAGLCNALHQAGHQVETLRLPFRFFPEAEIARNMAHWADEDLTRLNGYEPDRVICLKFPSYYLRHPHKTAWLLHQHRSVYELWDEQPAHSAEACALRERIHAQDTRSLSEIAARFTISQTVCDRLQRYNGLSSTALYHPPPFADRIYSAPAESYIFFPSRLETLKRQSLLIRAMTQVRSPVVALLAGTGGQEPALRQLIAQEGLEQRVRLLGPIDEAMMLACYAHCLAVFFGPQDEDYGYVTLEAMLAAKPVITCTDSGGPLEFVQDGATGRVVAPEPAAVAAAIDELHQQRHQAAQLGQQGRDHYHSLAISWENVVSRLLSDDPSRMRP